MTVYPNGKRYQYTKLYDEELNSPYNYSDDGLLRHMMSPRIVDSNNPITRFIVCVFEKEIVMLLKLTDILANFKNPYFKNR
jgi:hypothetical protein